MAEIENDYFIVENNDCVIKNTHNLLNICDNYNEQQIDKILEDKILEDAVNDNPIIQDLIVETVGIEEDDFTQDDQCILTNREIADKLENLSTFINDDICNKIEQLLKIEKQNHKLLSSRTISTQTEEAVYNLDLPTILGLILFGYLMGRHY